MNKTKSDNKTETNKNRPLCSIMDLIYPPTCGICGKLNRSLLCKKCELMLDKQAKFVVEKNKCCDKNFMEHLYIFKYEGIIRKIIIDYKFNDKSYLYRTFVKFLLKNQKMFKILQTYDTIVPVPISKKRQKERGYNQSYLIAREIAKYTDLKLENNCLFKTKNIIEQSKLNKEDRLKNIKGVYEIKNYQKLKNKKVILLDDIYTTGSTVDECCKILKKAKPRKMGVLTIAKD